MIFVPTQLKFDYEELKKNNFKFIINRLPALFKIRVPNDRMQYLHDKQTIESKKIDNKNVNKKQIGSGQDQNYHVRAANRQMRVKYLNMQNCI